MGQYIFLYIRDSYYMQKLRARDVIEKATARENVIGKSDIARARDHYMGVKNHATMRQPAQRLASLLHPLLKLSWGAGLQPK